MALPASPIRQIAFFVPDAGAAAKAHHAAHGSGPFLLAENIPLARATYRGQPAHLDHSSAYGQWGDVMVEFVQQNNPGPRSFTTSIPRGRAAMDRTTSPSSWRMPMPLPTSGPLPAIPTRFAA